MGRRSLESVKVVSSNSSRRRMAFPVVDPSTAVAFLSAECACEELACEFAEALCLSAVETIRADRLTNR